MINQNYIYEYKIGSIRLNSFHFFAFTFRTEIVLCIGSNRFCNRIHHRLPIIHSPRVIGRGRPRHVTVIHQRFFSCAIQFEHFCALWFKNTILIIYFSHSMILLTLQELYLTEFKNL